MKKIVYLACIAAYGLCVESSFGTGIPEESLDSVKEQLAEARRKTPSLTFSGPTDIIERLRHDPEELKEIAGRMHLELKRAINSGSFEEALEQLISMSYLRLTLKNNKSSAFMMLLPEEQMYFAAQFKTHMGQLQQELSKRQAQIDDLLATTELPQAKKEPSMALQTTKTNASEFSKSMSTETEEIDKLRNQVKTLERRLTEQGTDRRRMKFLEQQNEDLKRKLAEQEKQEQQLRAKVDELPEQIEKLIKEMLQVSQH